MTAEKLKHKNSVFRRHFVSPPRVIFWKPSIVTVADANMRTLDKTFGVGGQ